VRSDGGSGVKKGGGLLHAPSSRVCDSLIAVVAGTDNALVHVSVIRH
jgi:hypothetical protein